MPQTMSNRERYRTTLRRQEPDRVPLLECSFWPETLERWNGEGMPEGADPDAYFGLDCMRFAYLDCSLRLACREVEETEDFRITTDADGVTVQAWKDHYATPLRIDHDIKIRDDWERLKGRLTEDEGRISEGMSEVFRQARQDQVFSCCSPAEAIWWIYMTLGDEETLILMATEPDWVEEMVRYQTDLSLRLLQRLVAEGTAPDALWYWSDLCYKNGMLFSPRTYRELFMPHHKRVSSFLHENDILLILHCDGYLAEFVPLLIEAGFDVIQPLEARCGNDVREYKPRFGDQISFIGNISMDVAAKGGEAWEEEVHSKVLAAKPGGGYVYHSDHSVPPTVSLATYQRGLEICRELGSYE